MSVVQVINVLLQSLQLKKKKIEQLIYDRLVNFFARWKTEDPQFDIIRLSSEN